MSAFTCTWMTPSISYSTGSSVVMILSSNVVDRVERGVERGGLAAAGRAGHEDDAVGQLRRSDESLRVRPRVHAELVDVELDDGAVEHAHDAALAEHRRQDAHAQFDRVAADVEFHAAVLRQTALGDVELGHDLDSRRDGDGELPRRRHHLVQHAVDAVRGS